MIMEKTTDRAKKLKAAVMLAVVLTSMVFISGCAEQTSIKSVEEASQVITNVSTDIEDVSSTLDDIDRGLGG